MITFILIILTANLHLINYNNSNEWTYLFNGKNLDGWEIKIRNHEIGINFKNTFKVENGSLKVSYEDYSSFDDKFGHIFYTKKKFKNYHLSLEYKFSGEHLKGAPDWSIKNSGIMLHCQDPKTMLIDQEFPVSAEMQLLGGLNSGKRPTANICTPGTDVDINGKMAKYHCINSNSKTYNKDDWINVEVIVFSDSLVHQIVEKDTVLTYSNIRVGGDEVPKNFLTKIDHPLKEGFISLQSEGHPVQFRKIKIKELDYD